MGELKHNNRKLFYYSSIFKMEIVSVDIRMFVIRKVLALQRTMPKIYK